MTSSGRSDWLDLERGLPTTEADTAALRAAAESGRLSAEEYIRFLGRLPAPTYHDLKRRPCPVGVPPFSLD